MGSSQDLDKLVQGLYQGMGAPAGVEGGHEGVWCAGFHTLGLCGDPQVQGMQHHAEWLVLSARGLSIGQVPHNGVAEGTAVHTQLVRPACVGGERASESGVPLHDHHPPFVSPLAPPPAANSVPCSMSGDSNPPRFLLQMKHKNSEWKSASGVTSGEGRARVALSVLEYSGQPSHCLHSRPAMPLVGQEPQVVRLSVWERISFASNGWRGPSQAALPLCLSFFSYATGTL